MYRIGFGIGDQALESDSRVQVVDLPHREVASCVMHGNLWEMHAVYEALFKWIDESGYRGGPSGEPSGPSGRQLYHESDPHDWSKGIVEIQVLVIRA